LSIGYRACNRARVENGDNVLVIGAGPIGLGAALVAKERGATVGVIDPFGPRLKLAKALGIDFGFDLQSDPREQAIATFGCRPNVVIEAVGSPITLEQSLDIVSAAGRVVFVGWTSESSRWRPDLFLKKELELLGSRNSSGIFPEVIQFYFKNLDRVKRLVTHRFRMEEVERAMAFIDTAGSQTMKVILGW